MIQKEKGTFVELHIPHRSISNGKLFLKGRGYYHHVLDNESKPNYSLLKSMKHDLAIHEMSKALEMSVALNAYQAQ